MGVDKTWQERVVGASHALARLEARVYFCYRRERHNPPSGHRDGVIGEYGVDRSDRQYPAGLDHQIDGLFWRHLRAQRCFERLKKRA
jgi:hypothetical protein